LLNTCSKFCCTKLVEAILRFQPTHTLAITFICHWPSFHCDALTLEVSFKAWSNVIFNTFRVFNVTMNLNILVSLILSILCCHLLSMFEISPDSIDHLDSITMLLLNHNMLSIYLIKLKFEVWSSFSFILTMFFFWKESICYWKVTKLLEDSDVICKLTIINYNVNFFILL
jgi:hypothetical protein